MEVTVTFRGKAELKAMIAKLPEAIRERHMAAIEVTAKEIVRNAQARAPLLKGDSKQRKRGALRDSIGYSLSPSTLSAKVGIKKNGVKYAHLVEYGTAVRRWRKRRHPGKSTGAMPRHPFMAPSVEGERPGYEQRMKAAGKQVEVDLTASGGTI